MSNAHEIAMALRSTYWTMHRRTMAALAEHGVTADQFVALVILDRDGELIQRELVERASSDPNTIGAMLQLLEKAGLVERYRHPSDGRAKCVRVSAEGRRRVRKLTRALDPIHQRMNDALSEAESDCLVQALERMSAAIDEEEVKTDKK